MDRLDEFSLKERPDDGFEEILSAGCTAVPEELREPVDFAERMSRRRALIQAALSVTAGTGYFQGDSDTSLSCV
ncbi:MAG TPA: hypothetical protein VMR45_02885 [Patescibacteria group bacterium]|nr:hypothetical protein [Patescibacteria group bacterium]